MTPTAPEIPTPTPETPTPTAPLLPRQCPVIKAEQEKLYALQGRVRELEAAYFAPPPATDAATAAILEGRPVVVELPDRPAIAHELQATREAEAIQRRRLEASWQERSAACSAFRRPRYAEAVRRVDEAAAALVAAQAEERAVLAELASGGVAHPLGWTAAPPILTAADLARWRDDRLTGRWLAPAAE
jgi:hypothetical protein